MLSPQALIKGLVQRALPSTQYPDSSQNDVAPRMFPYGEFGVQSIIRKSHILADEGCYYTTHNNQAGIAPTYGTAVSVTAPFVVIQNQTASPNLRVYLDYLLMVAVAAGACTTAAGYIAAAVLVDPILRYTSGGTALVSPINPNTATPQNLGVNAWCGAITATAPSPLVRTVCGLRSIRPGVSTTVLNVVGDQYMLNFGGVEGNVASGGGAAANPFSTMQSLPPVILGQGHSALIYIWFPVMSAPSAATFAPEIGFWVR